MATEELPPFERDLIQLNEALEIKSLYSSFATLINNSAIATDFAIYYRDEESNQLYLSHASHPPRSATPHEIPHTATQSNDTTLIPLTFQGEEFGLLLLWQSSAIDQPMLIAAHHLGAALIRLQLYEESLDETGAAQEIIENVNNIASLLTNLELNVLLARLLDISLEIMCAQVGSIVLQRDGKLVSEIELGLRGEFLLNLSGEYDINFIEDTILQGQPVLIENVADDPRIELGDSALQLHSILCIPLISSSQTLGALTIVNTEGGLDEKAFTILTTISQLSASAIENAILQQNQLQAEHVKQQMDLAAAIQEKLQAKHDPAVEGLDIHGWCLPCDETGGDYYDYIPSRDGELGVVIGDASGHGLSAALMMIDVRSSLLTAIRCAGDLTTAFEQANLRNHLDSDAGHFMTLFCGLFSADRRSLHYCNAGHDAPLWYRPSSDRFLDLHHVTDVPLGVKKESAYALHNLEGIQPGDIFLFGTDGIWEAFDNNHTPFEISGLQHSIRSHHTLSAREMGTAIRNDILTFIGESSHTDDITAVVVKVGNH